MLGLLVALLLSAPTAPAVVPVGPAPSPGLSAEDYRHMTGPWSDPVECTDDTFTDCWFVPSAV